MKSNLKEKYIFWIFEYSLLIKVINSIWEIGLGLLIFFDKDLKQTIDSFTQNQLARRPHNYLVRNTEHFVSNISGATMKYISIYLILQALVKIFLITGIMKKKLWAYHAAIYAFFLFILYQLYRYLHTHSPILIILSIFDVITILLIQHEYKRVRKHLPDY